MVTKVEVPKAIYQDDKACAEFIVDINERLAQLSTIEKALKEAKDVAVNVMLERLEITGQKHFAYDFGTFSKTIKTQLAFPSAEKGGKDAAVEWLDECVERGIIDTHDLMSVQQARVSAEPLLAIEALVAEYNETEALKNPDSFVPVPPSPFNRYEQVTLSTPRKRKS